MLKTAIFLLNLAVNWSFWPLKENAKLEQFKIKLKEAELNLELSRIEWSQGKSRFLIGSYPSYALIGWEKQPISFQWKNSKTKLSSMKIKSQNINRNYQIIDRVSNMKMQFMLRWVFKTLSDWAIEIGLLIGWNNSENPFQKNLEKRQLRAEKTERWVWKF